MKPHTRRFSFASESAATFTEPNVSSSRIDGDSSYQLQPNDQTRPGTQDGDSVSIGVSVSKNESDHQLVNEADTTNHAISNRRRSRSTAASSGPWETYPSLLREAWRTSSREEQDEINEGSESQILVGVASKRTNADSTSPSSNRKSFVKTELVVNPHAHIENGYDQSFDRVETPFSVTGIQSSEYDNTNVHGDRDRGSNFYQDTECFRATGNPVTKIVALTPSQMRPLDFSFMKSLKSAKGRNTPKLGAFSSIRLPQHNEETADEENESKIANEAANNEDIPITGFLPLTVNVAAEENSCVSCPNTTTKECGPTPIGSEPNRVFKTLRLRRQTDGTVFSASHHNILTPRGLSLAVTIDKSRLLESVSTPSVACTPQAGPPVDVVERPSSSLSSTSYCNSNSFMSSTSLNNTNWGKAGGHRSLLQTLSQSSIPQSKTPIHLKSANRESPSVQASLLLSHFEVNSSFAHEERIAIQRTDTGDSIPGRNIQSPQSHTYSSSRVRKAEVFERNDFTTVSGRFSPIGMPAKANTFSYHQEAVTMAVSSANDSGLGNELGRITQDDSQEISNESRMISEASPLNSFPSASAFRNRLNSMHSFSSQMKRRESAANVLEKALVAAKSVNSVQPSSPSQSNFAASPTLSTHSQPPAQSPGDLNNGCSTEMEHADLDDAQTYQTSVAVGIKKSESQEYTLIKKSVEQEPNDERCERQCVSPSIVMVDSRDSRFASPSKELEKSEAVYRNKITQSGSEPKGSLNVDSILEVNEANVALQQDLGCVYTQTDLFNAETPQNGFLPRLSLDRNLEELFMHSQPITLDLKEPPTLATQIPRAQTADVYNELSTSEEFMKCLSTSSFASNQMGSGDFSALNSSPEPNVEMSFSSENPSCTLCQNHSHALPIFTIPGEEVSHQVSRDTVADLIMGKYDDKIASYVIIDCRFEFEYLGGHIDGAININNPFNLYDLFMKLISAAKLNARKHKMKPPARVCGTPHEDSGDGVYDYSCGCPCPEKPIVIIFHCEYSIERGVEAWKLFRALDRNTNQGVWPHLTFPEIMLMSGGYRKFYDEYRHLCSPNNFVSMFHVDYSKLRHKELARRARFKKANVRRLIAGEFAGSLYQRRRHNAITHAAGVILPVSSCKEVLCKTDLPSQRNSVGDCGPISNSHKQDSEANDIAIAHDQTIIDKVQEEKISVLQRLQDHQSHECALLAVDWKSCSISNIAEGNLVGQSASAFKKVFENAASSALRKPRQASGILVHPCHNRYTKSLYPSIISPLSHTHLSFALAFAAKLEPAIANALVLHRSIRPNDSRGENMGMYENNLSTDSSLLIGADSLNRLMKNADEQCLEDIERHESDLKQFQDEAMRLEKFERQMRMAQKCKELQQSDSSSSNLERISNGNELAEESDLNYDDDDYNYLIGDIAVAREILSVTRSLVESTAKRLLETLERDCGDKSETDDAYYHSDLEDAENAEQKELLKEIEAEKSSIGFEERRALQRRAAENVRAQFKVNDKCKDYEATKKKLIALKKEAGQLDSIKACLQALRNFFDTEETYRVGCIDEGVNIGNPNRDLNVDREFNNVIILSRNSLKDDGTRSRMLPHAALWYELIYGPNGIDNGEVFLPGSMETSFLNGRSEEDQSTQCQISESAYDTEMQQEGNTEMICCDLESEDEMRLSERRSLTTGESFPVNSSIDLSSMDVSQPSSSQQGGIWLPDPMQHESIVGLLSSSDHVKVTASQKMHHPQLPVNMWDGCGCSCHFDLEKYMKVIYGLEIDRSSKQKYGETTDSMASLSLQNGLARAAHALMSRGLKLQKMYDKMSESNSAEEDLTVCWREFCNPNDDCSSKTATQTKKGSRCLGDRFSECTDSRSPTPSRSLKNKLFVDSPAQDGSLLSTKPTSITEKVQECIRPASGIELSPEQVPSFCLVCGCIQPKSDKKAARRSLKTAPNQNYDGEGSNSNQQKHLPQSDLNSIEEEIHKEMSPCGYRTSMSKSYRNHTIARTQTFNQQLRSFGSSSTILTFEEPTYHFVGGGDSSRDLQLPKGCSQSFSGHPIIRPTASHPTRTNLSYAYPIIPDQSAFAPLEKEQLAETDED